MSGFWHLFIAQSEHDLIKTTSAFLTIIYTFTVTS